METQRANERRGGRRTTLLALAGGMLGAAATPAAALVDVRIGTCTVVISSPGILTPSADLRSLSTANPGGRAARATVSTILNGGFPHLTCSLVAQVNCFRVTLVPPTQFSSAPRDGDAGVLFTAQMQPQGGSSLLNLLSAVVLNGTQTIDLTLTATKTQGSFTAGTYQAEQTIRCE